MSHVTRSQAKQLVGQEIYAMKRDGTVVRGKLIRIKGNELILKPVGETAQTQAILPLALFDLLAISTLPFAGFGFGGFGYPGFGYPGFGYPGFFW